MAWEDGKALTLEAAVSLALEGATPGPTANDAPGLAKHSYKPGSNLTRRELEVLRLVAVGLTNADIAQHLSLSVLTVQTHLHSIFSKIDIKSRAAAVRYVFEHNLG